MSKIVSAFGPDGFGSYEADLAKHSFRRVDGKADTLLIPGFVDIHTHGAFGIDFMSATTDEMVSLCEQLRAVGYEGFLPTTVTASVTDVSKALAALPTHRMILGFHLEGPFISPVFPGAQPPSWIIDAPEGPSEWDAVLDDPRLKVITMAAERPGALDVIRRLTHRGVRVSMGHTNATYAEANQGFLAGADHTTHTFNAMRPLHHREAGMVGFALGTDAIFSELIYDRHHVCKESAEILLRCKPADKVVAVSDSTKAAGMAAGQTIFMWGLECVVGDHEVRLTNGTLAGSGITLYDAFRNLYEDFGPEVAIRSCCINPRTSIGISETPKMYVELDSKLDIVALHDVEN